VDVLISNSKFNGYYCTFVWKKTTNVL